MAKCGSTAPATGVQCTLNTHPFTASNGQIIHLDGAGTVWIDIW